MTIPEHDDSLRSATRRARVVEVNDKGSQQLVDLKGMKNEKPKKIWRPQDFGFTSVPPVESDGIIDQLGSRSDRTVYRDGGHEKYRPKRTPKGCTALFNQFGDIIRVFKDNADVVHQKTINIRIGHGYKAGDSGEDSRSSQASSGGGDDQPDDEKGKDTKTISIVATTDAITITYQDASVKLSQGEIKAVVGGASLTMTTDTITAKAGTVVLDGEVKLGSPSASRPASAQGTIDSRGDADSGNFATKVFVV